MWTEMTASLLNAASISHWDGFEPTVSGTTVPRTSQPVCRQEDTIQFTKIDTSRATSGSDIRPLTTRNQVPKKPATCAFTPLYTRPPVSTAEQVCDIVIVHTRHSQYECENGAELRKEVLDYYYSPPGAPKPKCAILMTSTFTKDIEKFIRKKTLARILRAAQKSSQSFRASSLVWADSLPWKSIPINEYKYQKVPGSFWFKQCRGPGAYLTYYRLDGILDPNNEQPNYQTLRKKLRAITKGRIAGSTAYQYMIQAPEHQGYVANAEHRGKHQKLVTMENALRHREGNHDGAKYKCRFCPCYWIKTFSNCKEHEKRVHGPALAAAEANRTLPKMDKVDKDRSIVDKVYQTTTILPPGSDGSSLL
ncbi:hypothetical protein BDZ85DRAFT_253357 [Elsinoe ampelina]|uniref:Uncharacterized protein n=1 Tax=Elsinoe ampelina TaxID=302913 RepID=A0A6A6FZ25_9PEZI|nr:hypothetical protein BDZ85DRAFT_253357 [Elsinoe ampelina]